MSVRAEASLLAAALTSGGLLGATACGQAIEPIDGGLRVEYTGCDTVFTGPICTFTDQPMVLWIEAERDAELAIRGGRVISDTAAFGGRRVEVDIEPTAAEILVSVSEDRRQARWSLDLRPAANPPWFDEGWRLFGENDLAAARALAEPHLRDPQDRGLALGLLAQIALSQDERREAERLFRDAVRSHREAGRLSSEVWDGAILVWILIEQGRPREAGNVLGGLPRGEGLPGRLLYSLAYYDGLLAKESGDLRLALRRTVEAVEIAERLGLARERALAEEMLAGHLQKLGRVAESHEVLTKAGAEASLRPCERAQLLDNTAWALLLDLEAGQSVSPPVAELEDAIRLYEEECPEQRAARSNTVLNLALASYHAGKFPQARLQLDRARSLESEPSPRLGVWSLDLEGRLDLAEGRATDAAAAYEHLTSLAADIGAPEAQWRAARGRGQALAALGRWEDAAAAYAEAERLVDVEAALVASYEGRDTFVARREPATREYLDLLLRLGRDAEGLAVARHARARVLRRMATEARLAALSPRVDAYLAARQELDAAGAENWQLAAEHAAGVEAQRMKLRGDLRRLIDDLSAAVAPTGEEHQLGGQLDPPAAAEVLLAYHPLPEGWVGFAATDRGVTSRKLGAIHPEALDAGSLAERLLAPFASEISAASFVRVLPFGALRAVDFHALPWRGAPLLATAPVAYGLDLPSPATAPQPAHGVALVVSNPTGDLPGAASEGDAASRELAREWRVETLAGKAATSAEVRRLLPEADLFHYAGHAIFAGRGGWESLLPLAGGTRLTIEEILSLKRAPEWVVLSGCEAAQSAQEAPIEAMGLAHAFLLAGALGVVAPLRPVVDSDAAELLAGLHAAWRGSGTPIPALQRAQLAMALGPSGADWASYRMIVR